MRPDPGVGDAPPIDQDTRKVIVVAAGVLRDSRDRLLVAERPDGKHLAGTWEFPGGKLEAGEDAAAALARELDEEIGVAVQACEPLMTLTYDYPEKTVRLLIRTVTRWTGEPRGREGQAVRWVALDELATLHMPAGNRPIARALGLNAAFSISPDPAAFGNFEAFLTDWARRAERGHLLQLRAHSVDDTALLELASECARIARRAGARWLLNGTPELAVAAGADGVHLTGRRVEALRTRPLGNELIVSASCHDLGQVRRAAALRLDFVTVSPVRPTATHPGSDSIGFDGLTHICRNSALPVYALGGMRPADLTRARAAGAFGVAGIRGFVNGES